MKFLESFGVKVFFMLLFLQSFSYRFLTFSLYFQKLVIYDNIILKVIGILMDRIDQARIQRT